MHTKKSIPHLSTNPTEALQAAIDKIQTFTQAEASRLEVQADGSLVAKPETHLKRVIGLAKCYLGSLLLGSLRQEQEKKIHQIKQEILQARDILKSHASLIEKLKTGNSSQKKLAHSALEAIQRYNALVVKDQASLSDKHHFYDYERKWLLQDKEIKGQPIELPRVVSIKSDAHINKETAQKTFKELGLSLLPAAAQKNYASFSSSHKKTEQFMVDTFRMKAVRLIQSHFGGQTSLADVLNLVKHSPIETHEDQETLFMSQQLVLGPGSTVMLTGSFQRPSTDSKLMSMPIIQSFKLTAELQHAGFPFPSEHTAWSLSNSLTEARPLRTEQVPLFSQLDQRKKQLSHLLLFDSAFILKARQLFKLKRDIFNQHQAHYLRLHRQLQEAILSETPLLQAPAKSILDRFYASIASSPSAFDDLVKSQERLLDLFIQQPAKQLEEEWLQEGDSVLRKGTPQEKFQAALLCLQNQRNKARSYLDAHDSLTPYLQLMGPVLGQAAQAILLQYWSEKMGFPPPMLNDFERKMQMCAFQQLGTFLDEQFIDNKDKLKQDMTLKYEADIQIFKSATIEDLEWPSSFLINELEVYFNSRFYSIG